MKCLVLSTDYPNLNGGVTLAYVRTRNVYYKSKGVDVTVLNFAASGNYTIDGISVITYKWFSEHCTELQFDMLISHAPNLKNHYRFLRKYDRNFQKIVFFFHGHEVLKINKVYSAPYRYVRRNNVMRRLQDIYDEFKFRVWRSYIKKKHGKLYYIFVSNWMRDEFFRWVKPDPAYLEGRSYITYNCVGELFEKGVFDNTSPKRYDFVTIRANLDGSKYSVDIVNELAKRHPEYKFLLVGKGEFFDHYDKAPNIEWRDCRLQHGEITDVLNSARCALMPTRTDAQGVMMCEMAAFGMPLITSDIPVCHEVFGNEPNIGFINNNLEPDNLKDEFSRIKDIRFKSDKYSMHNTCDTELDIFDRIENHTD